MIDSSLDAVGGEKWMVPSAALELPISGECSGQFFGSRSRYMRYLANEKNQTTKSLRMIRGTERSFTKDQPTNSAASASATGNPRVVR